MNSDETQKKSIVVVWVVLASLFATAFATVLVAAGFWIWILSKDNETDQDASFDTKPSKSLLSTKTVESVPIVKLNSDPTHFSNKRIRFTGRVVAVIKAIESHAILLQDPPSKSSAGQAAFVICKDLPRPSTLASDDLVTLVGDCQGIDATWKLTALTNCSRFKPSYLNEYESWIRDGDASFAIDDFEMSIELYMKAKNGKRPTNC